MAAGFDFFKACNSEATHYATSVIDTGWLVLKKVDKINNIIAGTFWFNATNSTGAKVEVRDGRFDMQLSQ